MTYEDFRAGELQGWDARADAYDTATARATVQSIPDLLATVRLAPGMRLLDVCCGPGYAAGVAAVLGGEAQGIDFAPAMVRVAQARFPGLVFDEGDAEELRLADASFDAVVCNFGLCHVTAPDRAANEALRVLRLGGRYTFSQWCAPEENPLYRIMQGILHRHADMSVAPSAPDGFALSDRAAARRFLARAGFADMEVREVSNILRAPAAGFFDFFMRVGVRIPLVLERQAEASQRAIRTDFDREMQAFVTGGEVRVPMPSIVVSGRKPDSAP